MSLAENINAAYHLGHRAFFAGIAAPAADPVFALLQRTAIDARIIGTYIGASLPLLEAWNAGKIAASVEA